jgi:GMP synthase (glutamine-hydrolysing)
MKVMVLIHTESEGPGSLGIYLLKKGVQINTVRLDLGDAIPNIDGYNGIVSMGGSMNVYEDSIFPFLRSETEVLAQAIKSGVPVLGICLGAQMIARASGANVVKAPKQEIGWSPVELLPAAMESALLKGLPEEMEVFQYHGDMFNIPEKGTLLAKSNDCPHQAFSIANAFGLQFHVEVLPSMLETWFRNSKELPDMLQKYNEIENVLTQRANLVYDNFIKMMNSW